MERVFGGIGVLSGADLAEDSVRYTGPGASDLGVSTRWQWRPDFEEVLAALRAGGASVELAQRDATEPV